MLYKTAREDHYGYFLFRVFFIWAESGEEVEQVKKLEKHPVQREEIQSSNESMSQSHEAIKLLSGEYHKYSYLTNQSKTIP